MGGRVVSYTSTALVVRSATYARVWADATPVLSTTASARNHIVRAKKTLEKLRTHFCCCIAISPCCGANAMQPAMALHTLVIGVRVEHAHPGE